MINLVLCSADEPYLKFEMEDAEKIYFGSNIPIRPLSNDIPTRLSLCEGMTTTSLEYDVDMSLSVEEDQRNYCEKDDMATKVVTAEMTTN